MPLSIRWTTSATRVTKLPWLLRTGDPYNWASVDRIGGFIYYCGVEVVLANKMHLQISIILLFYRCGYQRENFIFFKKVILDKYLIILLWLVSNPDTSCLSLPNSGIAGANCVQLEENFKAMVYQDENLTAHYHTIPVQGAWQHDVPFFFLNCWNNKERVPPYLLLCSQKKFSTGPDYFLSHLSLLQYLNPPWGDAQVLCRR